MEKWIWRQKIIWRQLQIWPTYFLNSRNHLDLLEFIIFYRNNAIIQKSNESKSKKRIWRQKLIWRQANYANYAWLIMHNMSHIRVRSCKLFHTIIICNIKSPPCTKLEILDFAQKLPGHAQIKEISISWDQIFFWTWNFQGWFLTIIAIISEVLGK